MEKYEARWHVELPSGRTALVVQQLENTTSDDAWDWFESMDAEMTGNCNLTVISCNLRNTVETPEPWFHQTVFTASFKGNAP